MILTTHMIRVDDILLKVVQDQDHSWMGLHPLNASRSANDHSDHHEQIIF